MVRDIITRRKIIHNDYIEHCAVEVQAKKHKDTGSGAMEHGAHDATCDGSDCHLYIKAGKGFGDH